MLVVIGTDCIGSYKANYHTNSTTIFYSNFEKWHIIYITFTKETCLHFPYIFIFRRATYKLKQEDIQGEITHL